MNKDNCPKLTKKQFFDWLGVPDELQPGPAEKDKTCKCGHSLKDEHYIEIGHLTCMECSACCEEPCSFDEVVP